MNTFFLVKPTQIKLDKQEILISEHDFKKNVTVNTRKPFNEINELCLVSDSSSISKGAIKALQGKQITFISKGKPIAFIAWMQENNSLHHYSKKMSELKESQKRKLAFVFCKAVCLGRIYQARRMNERRNDKDLKKKINDMALLERILVKEYKDDFKLKALEGNIAKLFFSIIRSQLSEGINFNERNPKNHDLYNVLLNASHGLLRKKIAEKIFASGLNSSFGFLHFQKDKRHPFLVWDFAELWIPYIDKLCFYAVNKRIFTERHLINSKDNDGGKWLNEDGWKKLHELFEKRFKDKEIDLKLNEFKEFLDKKRKRFSWVI